MSQTLRDSPKKECILCKNVNHREEICQLEGRSVRLIFVISFNSSLLRNSVHGIIIAYSFSYFSFGQND
jgi:hypothetical protein